MSSVRVYQVAKDLGVDPKTLLQKMHVWGITARNSMSSLLPEEVTRIKRNIDRESQTNIVEETVRSGIVRRRKIQPAVPKPTRPVEEPAVAKPEPAPEPVPEPEDGGAEPQAVEAAEAAAAPAEPAAPEPPSPVVEEPAPSPSMSAAPPASVPAPTTPPPAAPPIAVVPTGPVITRPAVRPAIPELTTTMPSGPKIISRPGMPGHPGMPAPPPALIPRRQEVRGVNLLDAKNKKIQDQQRFKKKKAAPPGRKDLETKITTPSEAKRVIQVEEQVSLQTLAARMSVKSTEVLMKLFSLGVTDANINKKLDIDTAKLIAGEFGYHVEDVAVSDEALLEEARKTVGGKEDFVVRPPVVTVMGHVDHGKTSLLDAIRKTKVADGEAGGITQHIGAYRVETSRGPVVFLDTPGHEAFSAMRARGAQSTDIVVLVVAADDGVMPQTLEALNHAKAAEVPIIVAVNKIDKPEAQAERVMRQLADHGVVPEEWGGPTAFRQVSAKSGQGLEELVERIALEAEIMELRANAAAPATGGVLEAYLDRGRGPVARVLVRDGTLRTGDIVVAGTAWGKIRAMVDDRGKSVEVASPATPVEILGLSGVPNAGDPFDAVTDLRSAEGIVEQRMKKRGPSVAADAGMSLAKIQEMIATGDQAELRVVLKADVQGSVEAVAGALVKLTGEKVRVSVIHAAVGGITESDINLAAASKAILVGFNVRPTGKSTSVAEVEGVEIRLYSIIYEMLDEIRKAMAGLLAPTSVEKALGRADVLQVFNISGAGTVAGCRVADGKITRTAKVRLVRDSIQVWTGKIGSLRRFKEDVREVVGGYECGIGLEGYGDVKQGDIIEAFELQEVAASL